jgi:tetratricopeptide (TPR) repeat protein
MSKPKNPPRWVGRKGRPVLGVTMIVKNEAERLPALFADLADVADEVVVVDTGSTDGTRAICQAWGVTLIRDAWRDDFSRARNRAIQAATARYVLWLDGDDRLPPETREGLKRLRDTELATSDVAYRLHVINLDAAGGHGDAFLQPRIVPNRPGVRFERPVHEQVAPSLAALGIRSVEVDLVIEHAGYATPEEMARKALRNEALLRRVIAENGPDVHLLVHLAQALLWLGRTKEAEAAIGDALAQLGDGNGELAAQLHAFRGELRSRLGNALGAKLSFRAALEAWPEWGVPLVPLARIALAENEPDVALEHLEAARTRSIVAGLIAFPIRRIRSDIEFLTGIALRARDRQADIVPYFEAALRIDPMHLDARIELGQALLDRGEYAEARRVLEPAGSDPAAVARFVDVSVAIGVARALSGDLAGGEACLAPIVDLFAEALGHPTDVDPMQLAEALLRGGYPRAALNLVNLAQRLMTAGTAG